MGTGQDDEEAEALVASAAQGAHVSRRWSSPFRRHSPVKLGIFLFAIAIAVVIVGGAAYAFRNAADDSGSSSNGSISKSTANIDDSSSNVGSKPPWKDQCHDLAALANEPTRSQQDGQCTSSRASRAADILKAQELLMQMDDVCFAEEGGNNCTVALNPQRKQQAKMSPDWIGRRDPFFGLWLWPRLKLVLFACPKCGNSQVRTSLNRLSEEIQKNEKVDSMQTIQLKGNWTKESDHSWQFTSPRLNIGNEAGKNALLVEQNPLAYEYVDELLADPEWTSLGVVRHPYERLISGYSELEFRWNRFVTDPEHRGPRTPSSMDILDQGTFWHQPKNTPQRALAFWSELVLGQMHYADSVSRCLLPIAELYHMSPIGAFFLQDASQCETSSLYTTERVIDIAELHNDWPKFIQHWEGSWNSSVASELARMADKHGNSKAGSPASETMRELLATNDAFRRSFEAFYSHDFTTFGFSKDPSIIHIG